MDPMNICSPSEFVDRWPGVLRPIAFPDPLPELPDDCKQTLIKFGLPRELTIHCYNDITIKFSGEAKPLAVIWERDLKRSFKMGQMPSNWMDLWHLADQEYTQGGGWICIESVTGRLLIVDLDLPKPVYLLNSSVTNFYTTLSYFLDWSTKSDRGLAQISLLRKALYRQKCIPLSELEPFWMNFIDAAHGGDPMELEISARGGSRTSRST